MAYIENPKTKGSGIICCIPQAGRCPNNCKDCFFQSGRSYLEPLEQNLPNIPPEWMAKNRIVWVNDGNDSNVERDIVMDTVASFPRVFYNTAINHDLEGFDAPVVLTLNPADYTDRLWHRVDPIPENLMFVRIRTNAWNIEKVVDPAVKYYSEHNVPVVLTFMAYYEENSIPEGKAPGFMHFVRHDTGHTIIRDFKDMYMWRTRTLNSYWAIRADTWRQIMGLYRDNKWVSSCGFEGEKGTTACRHCGVCLREYFATMERMGKLYG